MFITRCRGCGESHRESVKDTYISLGRDVKILAFFLSSRNKYLSLQTE